jgi:uncharacterized protein YjbI with pentapeptide repeats
MLYHTDFSQARLMDATLANAYLGDANLTKADLLRTNLSGGWDPCRGATISRVCCAYGSNGGSKNQRLFTGIQVPLSNWQNSVITAPKYCAYGFEFPRRF